MLSGRVLEKTQKRKHDQEERRRGREADEPVSKLNLLQNRADVFLSASFVSSEEIRLEGGLGGTSSLASL